MHKLKNKHAGEIITTPYMAEAEEYLNSGDYEMSDKPVYTKEMHERGELPPVGSCFVMVGISINSSWKRFEGLPCEVLSLTEYKGRAVVTFYNVKEGFGALWHIESMKPIPTIEDELSNEIANYTTQPKAIDCSELADLLLTKYNITPKDS